MKIISENSLFFGVFISLFAYEVGLLLKKKLKWAFLNPLLISIVLVIFSLKMFRIEFKSFNEGAKYLSYLLTPATVCLAIPLYRQIRLLRENFWAVILGILAGVVSSLVSVLGLALLFGLNHAQYVTLLPKSITTAIGMGLSEEMGGYVTITVAVIIITGIVGNILGEFVCKYFRIHHPIARGLALGTSAHAIGTVKAMEMGEIEGAMSSLSIAVAGLCTVVGASVFAMFL
ncbi:MAG TPA: LrgB family protein [Lachnospiraceae bacterium]